MVDFRHPSAIQQQLARYLKLHHRLEEALRVPSLTPENAAIGEQSKLFTAGVIAALEWALCTRKEIEPGDLPDESASSLPRDP